MKTVKMIVLWAGLVICAGSIVGASSGTVSEAGNKKNTGLAASTLAEQGREAYAANCARCHGMDGRGKTILGEMVEAPDLTDARLQKGISDARIRNSISRGRGMMPAFGKKLSKQEVAALARYVRSLKK